jgi:hypothetical protein
MENGQLTTVNEWMYRITPTVPLSVVGFPFVPSILLASKPLAPLRLCALAREFPAAMLARRACGGVGEWLNPPVLKTGDPQGSASSNLAPSAYFC